MEDQGVHEACAQLRFAEGLRRRSEEARAETTIKEAAGLALLEGARVDPAVLRDLVRDLPAGVQLGPDLGPDLAMGVGAWKATWSVMDGLPQLNPGRNRVHVQVEPPLRQLLADMQRNYGSALVGHGMATVEQIALPKDPQRWSGIMAAIQLPGVDAVTAAGRAWALLVVEQPFTHGNHLMGVLAAKWILASRGVEPTGVSVLSAHALAHRGVYEAALGAIRSGNWAPWEEFFAGTIVQGCEVGQQISRHVQAGIPS